MHAALMANACKKSTTWNCSNLKIQRNQKGKKVLKIYANMTISIYLIITLSFAGSF